MSTTATRLEHDLLGDKAVPADAYYGVQTARALENFHISGVPLSLYPNLIKGLGDGEDGGGARQLRLRPVQQGDPDRHRGRLPGTHRRQAPRPVPLDVFQGGAGTSTNMNANEVIANRALELMGHRKGEYKHCDPHDHVNCSQSTNDAYPSALHVGMALGNIQLVAAVNELIAAFRAKGKEFSGILKMGRTQLQDAVPMTLGQEFEAFAATLAGEVQALQAIQRVLCEVNMGATAIGTGLNAPAGYAAACTKHLAAITGLPIHLADEPDRGDAGHAGVRPLLVLHEEPGDQAVEDLQRPAPALLGTALRPARDQSAGQTTRLLHHAGQGQPGHSRGREHGLLPRHRQRPDGVDGRRRRAAAAQRLRAGDRRVHLRSADDVHERGADAARALHRRHHGQRRRPAATTSSTASASSPRSIPSSATSAPRSLRPKR